MIVRLLAPLALLVGLLVATPALAAPGPCPDAGGTAYLVDTPAEAATLAGGYSNNACDLVVSADVAPTVQDWNVAARSFTVTGAAIINTLAGSAIHVSVPLDITLVNATLKSRTDLFLRSTSVLGTCAATGSTLVASSTLDVFAIPGNPGSGPALGGNLTIQCFGDITSVATSTYGGSRIFFISGADVAWLCVPPQNRTACDDPLILCPGGFPCQRTFASAAEFVQVACQAAPGPPPICSGGVNEVRVSAKGNIDLTGSVFTFLSHASFETTNGTIEAPGTNINVVTNLTFKSDGPINAVGAQWSAGQTLRVITGNACTAPSECISATNASALGGTNVIFQTHANQGGIDLCGGAFTTLAPGIPRMNGAVALPYPASVKEDAAECAPLAAAVIQ